MSSSQIWACCAFRHRFVLLSRWLGCSSDTCGLVVLVVLVVVGGLVLLFFFALKNWQCFKQPSSFSLFRVRVGHWQAAGHVTPRQREHSVVCVKEPHVLLPTRVFFRDKRWVSAMPLTRTRMLLFCSFLEILFFVAAVWCGTTRVYESKLP